MFKKSFAETLKENLREDSFKPPPPPPKPVIKYKESPTLFHEELLDPFLREIKKYYITEEGLKSIYGSRSFYKGLFKEPVKMVFYWCEEDYQGSLFVIYKYENKYIYIHGGFGSCEVCDGFPQSEDSLRKIFRNLEICDNIENIELAEYSHPDLVKDFEKYILQNTLPKQTLTHKTSIQKHKLQKEYTPKNITNWASLFK
jgi:hypothetical protein